MADKQENNEGALTIDPIVREAIRRFNRCAKWEAQARQNFLNDYKFAHGDSDNGYQWPNRIRQNRDVDARPCLTMNVVRQHNLQIQNEARQNKSSVAFRAVGGQATKESADLYEAMFRRIEYQSDAQSAYQTAVNYQVTGGWGWIRLVTEYEDTRTFNVDMRIKRVWDPLSIYMDMDCKEFNCSDSRYGLVFDLVPDDELEEAYPSIRGKMSQAPLGTSGSDDGWTVKDHTRVCEYFRKVFKTDWLISFVDPADKIRKEVLKSQLPEGVFEELQATPLSKWREVQVPEVQWYLIVGQEIVDKTIWPGMYIPLIRVLGEEIVIDGVMDRIGHTRGMKDSQRMYNYNASAQIEFGALQSKTPWIAAAKAIEEYEQMWNTANTVNHSVLVYNNLDDEGNEIQAPQRTQPPAAAPLYESGMTTAFNQMMMTSGQWQNQMGMGGNERTGAAIDRRQEQSYTAVYHFQDNYANALRFIGKQFLDIVPKIYDTKRLMRLQAQDGEEFDLQLDPGAPQLLMQQLDQDGEIVARVLNPQMGQFDVQSDVGPAYGTRREETVRAMTLLLTQAPALTGIIGDLLLNAMNFKEASEAAVRLKRMVPDKALGKGPSPEVTALQQQVVQLQGLLSQSLQRQGKAELKLVGKNELRDVQAYEAETKRMAALPEEALAAAPGLRDVIAQLVEDALATKLAPMAARNLAEETTAAVLDPPLPGARKAADGEWYLADKDRPGKYLKVKRGKNGAA